MDDLINDDPQFLHVQTTDFENNGESIKIPTLCLLRKFAGRKRLLITGTKALFISSSTSANTIWPVYSAMSTSSSLSVSLCHSQCSYTIKRNYPWRRELSPVVLQEFINFFLLNRNLDKHIL